MIKLMRYLRGYEKESVIGPLFKMLEALFELIVPIIMARIIDVGIKNADGGYIMKMACVLVLLGILGLASSLTAQYFAAKAAYGFGTKLRRDMYRHINSLSYAEIDSIGTSVLITRLTSDINLAQTGVNQVLRLFLRSPFIVAGALIMAFTVDPKCAAVFAAATPVLGLIIYGIILGGIPLYKRAQKKLDVISLITRENLTGVRVIRAFSRQKDELRDFAGANADFQKMQKLAGKISALTNPLTYVFVNLAIAAVIWVGGGQVDSGRITQGEVIALVNYMMQILLALVAMAVLIAAFTKAAASAVRINEIFAVKSSMKDEAAADPEPEKNSPKIELSDVSFSYSRSGAETLSGISFSVKRGETVGIIGGTGSGKTTLVNLIARFYDPDKGEIKIDGRPVKEYTLAGLRAKIGIVPQKAVLFSGTIRDNMKWGAPELSDEQLYSALKTAQALDFVNEKPRGIDEMLSRGGKNLSGGQRQRLTIARALAMKPEILIMDDSASALDFATDAKLRRAIAEETGDMTVIIVSQRASGVRSADKIIVLDDGKIAGAGSHEELFKSCAVYREICLSQLYGEDAE